jgi:hypothetical protein
VYLGGNGGSFTPGDFFVICTIEYGASNLGRNGTKVPVHSDHKILDIFDI